MGYTERYISEEKLKQPFKPFNVLDLEYVKLARHLAEQYSGSEPIAQDDLIKIRLLAVQDRNHLKGDFVIGMFLDLIESEKRKPKRWDKGRRLGIGDRLLDKLLENHLTKTKTAKAFCSENPVSLYTYRSIVNLTVKNAADRERVISHLKAICAEINKM
ncbi:hypothetical protein FACS189425_04830 [Clostridia bacterium]|nr:hypothetical protein FACS189425_04830 [Clostridia bacterium]